MPSIDLQEFCRLGASRAGVLGAPELPRIADVAIGFEPLNWSATGGFVDRREHAAQADRPTIAFRLDGRIRVACTRCLTPVDLVLDLRPRYVFFETDAQADAAPADDDLFEYAVAERRVDVAALLEDEALIAIDERAVHAECPPQALAALGLAVQEGAVVRRDEPPSPFAALGAIKKH